MEVYVGEDRIFTTSQEYEKMKGFSEAEGKVTIPVNVSATGDITVAVYHARSTFGGKIQGKVGFILVSIDNTFQQVLENLVILM